MAIRGRQCLQSELKISFLVDLPEQFLRAKVAVASFFSVDGLTESFTRPHKEI